MMLKFEIIYDPSDKAIPLKLNLPMGTNPSMVICLLSQVITGLSQAAIAGDANALIVPAAGLAKLKS